MKKFIVAALVLASTQAFALSPEYCVPMSQVYRNITELRLSGVSVSVIKARLKPLATSADSKLHIKTACSLEIPEAAYSSPALAKLFVKLIEEEAYKACINQQ